MPRYGLMACGVIFAAAAQVLLKGAAGSTPYAARWCLWMAGSVAAYVVAFVLYAMMLRIFPISIVAPVMTVAVMCTVVIVGALLGEPVPVSRWVGILLGVAGIVMVLR